MGWHPGTETVISKRTGGQVPLIYSGQIGGYSQGQMENRTEWPTHSIKFYIFDQYLSDDKTIAAWKWEIPSG